MVDLDVIEPVDEPTDQVNGLVIVEKPNGKLQTCLDPRPLNQSINQSNENICTSLPRKNSDKLKLIEKVQIC